MKRAALFMVVGMASAGVLGLACSKKEEPARDYMVFGEFVNPQDTLPRVRYFEDGLVSLNDRCAVRKTKLNRKMPAVYVNGQPVGFC